jgi:hypothetical protein
MLRTTAFLCPLWALQVLSAQDAPVRVLGKPNAPAVGPFLEITGVRELNGDRVIVLDKFDRRLHVIDLRSGKAAQLGREGDGPGEYRLPLWMLALPSDTTAVYDMGNTGRFVVYGPDGKPARPIPIRYRGNWGPPEAVDAQGRFYVAEHGGPGLAKPYFGRVVRVDRNTNKPESVAVVSYLAVTPLPIPARPPRTGPAAPPFVTNDQWLVGLDGRIVVVQTEASWKALTSRMIQYL